MELINGVDRVEEWVWKYLSVAFNTDDCTIVYDVNTVNVPQQCPKPDHGIEFLPGYRIMITFNPTEFEVGFMADEVFDLRITEPILNQWLQYVADQYRLISMEVSLASIDPEPPLDTEIDN